MIYSFIMQFQGMLDTRISLEQFESLVTLTTNCFQTMMDLGKVTFETVTRGLTCAR